MMQYVIREKHAIGFILSTAKGYRAFDVDGSPIGSFDSEALAAKAIYQSDTTRPRDGR